MLGPTQKKILSYIRARSPTYTYEIASALGIDRGDVTKAVQALIVKGLVSHCEGQRPEIRRARTPMACTHRQIIIILCRLDGIHPSLAAPGQD